MSRRDFIFCNGNGELYDLIAIPQSADDLADSMSAHELYMHVALQGRCSGLVTVTRALPYNMLLLQRTAR